ncbi:MAG: TMEM175 family protein [Brevundimonas sp.]|uniref:TMEM175 family protein n=1 Tax=Brevundimonas sp. TaxID=1871086 RepID=UPI002602F01F|nr:TMEM175 family protein [Brevundimonas sp.]MDI6625588.1 TMEM175 family protein [Brevundimonas sp.]MDQ7811754.1 TMEM175 family protein [Brevundimonas sp.]
MGDGTTAGGRFTPAEAQRLDAFVDAAFAFAVSLLIIAGGEPLRSFDDLVHALMRIPAFLAGFALIILFWLAHRSWSSLGPRRDRMATLLSLAVVFSVLVFVFPLRLLTETALHFMTGGLLPGGGLIESFGQLGWIYAIYGFGFSILSVLYVLLFRHARAGLAVDDPRRQAASAWARTWALAAVTGVVSGGFALSPVVPAAPWLPGVVYWTMPIGIWIFAVMDRRRMRRLEAG